MKPLRKTISRLMFRRGRADTNLKGASKGAVLCFIELRPFIVKLHQHNIITTMADVSPRCPANVEEK